jgi:peptide/nickel transport system ATP-binding protein
MIFQEPGSSLNPVYTCGNQVREMFTTHKGLSRKESKTKTLQLFEKVGLKDSEKIYSSYPHEISGGQVQRVMIAMAMSCEPTILLADEPTTALDVTIQKNILELMDKMRQEMGTSIIFISHDLGVIAEVADRVLVMYKGKIVEHGTIEEIFVKPKHPYTKGLLACRPRLDVKLNVLPTIEDFMSENEDGVVTRKTKYNSIGEAIIQNAETKIDIIHKRMEVIKGGPLIKIRKLKKYYPIKKGIFGKIVGFSKAVDDVSFDIYPGESIGLVGESGCGKTTLGKTIIRLLDSTDGTVMFEGKVINHLTEKLLRPMRKDIQIIFQDPYSSLNPKHTGATPLWSL